MSWKNDFGWSDIITVASTIATLVMVVYTHFALKASKRSQEAAQRSAEAAEKSVERMKDSQLPYLSLSVLDPDPRAMAIYLNIRNIGPGLAKIRLVSIREDLRVNSVLNEPIKYWIGKPRDTSGEATGYERIVDFAIASGEEFTFLINFSTNYLSDGDHMSSLSVFFEDVYGRYYRSRILYKWISRQSNNQIRSIDSEIFSIDELPINTFDNYDIRELYELEGFARPIPFRGSYRCFYRKSFMSKVEGIMLNGNSFTQGRALRLEKIIEAWHGYPEFQLRIDNFPFFIIKPHLFEGQVVEYVIQAEYEFKEYGLISTGNNDTQLTRELYQSVVNELTNK